MYTIRGREHITFNGSAQFLKASTKRILKFNNFTFINKNKIINAIKKLTSLRKYSYIDVTL